MPKPAACMLCGTRRVTLRWPRARRPMFDKVGSFLGDKVGAVSGQLRTQRMWIKGFGRRARRIRATRARGARIGRLVGAIAGWIGRVATYLLGRCF